MKGGTPDARWSRWSFWGLTAAIALAAPRSGCDPSAATDATGMANAQSLLGGLLSPDLGGETLGRIATLTVDSLAIGVLGMALALVLGVPLALLAARLPGAAMRARASTIGAAFPVLVRTAARAVMLFLRGVPEIIWAYLFVRILGLGPGPAVLAIGLTFAGTVGKLYAEWLEAVDPRPIQALSRAGSSAAALMRWGAIPQVRSSWTAYGLFRLECAVRSASILGVVGAGGLGTEIDLSIRYFEYDKLATALLAVLVVVAALEAASSVLRRASFRSLLLGLAAAAAWSQLRIDLEWSALMTTGWWPEVPATAAGPTAAAWWGAGGLVLDTLTMAAVATAVAAAFALVTAPFANADLTLWGYSHAHGRRGLRRVLGASLFGGVRLLSALARAIPELVWALVFVVWMGPGPTAGVAAIGVHTWGILTRLFAEVLEEAERAAPTAAERAGHGPVGILRFALWPLVRGRLAAYGLFRFEVNVRQTAMMGFVGAGGIGDAIHTAISLFDFDSLGLLLTAMLIAVAVVDSLGGRIRHSWLATPSL